MFLKTKFTLQKKEKLEEIRDQVYRRNLSLCFKKLNFKTLNSYFSFSTVNRGVETNFDLDCPVACRILLPGDDTRVVATGPVQKFGIHTRGIVSVEQVRHLTRSGLIHSY